MKKVPDINVILVVHKNLSIFFYLVIKMIYFLWHLIVALMKISQLITFLSEVFPKAKFAIQMEQPAIAKQEYFP